MEIKCDHLAQECVLLEDAIRSKRSNVAVSLVVSIKRRNPLQLRTRADIVLRYLLLDAKDL